MNDEIVNDIGTDKIKMQVFKIIFIAKLSLGNNMNDILEKKTFFKLCQTLKIDG